MEGKAQAGLRVGLAPEVARDGHQPIPHQQDHRHQTCARQHVGIIAVVSIPHSHMDLSLAVLMPTCCRCKIAQSKQVRARERPICAESVSH